MSSPVGNRTAEIIKAFQAEQAEVIQQEAAEAEQVESETRLGEAEDFININAKFEKQLKAGKTDKAEKAERAQESVLIRKDDADSFADNFNQREGNRQYRLEKDQLSRLLQGLGSDIRGDSEIQDIISTIRNTMSVGGRAPDVGQIDKTFEFLLEVLQAKIAGEKLPGLKAQFQALYDKILASKNQHYKENGKAIDEAHKIIDIADIIVDSGKTDTPETLSHLREIIHNPQDLSTKFNYYRSKGYTFREIKEEIDSLLHFMGREFKRVEIPTAEMDALMKETRRSQAILQIFRYFKKASALGDRLFDLKDLPRPRGLNFELYSVLFMKLVDERYPSAEKILQLTPQILAIAVLTEDNLEAYYMKIIILGLIRDAIKEVSPNYVFRTMQHRDDLFSAIIDSLEELEDVVAEKEEQFDEQNPEEIGT